MNQSPILKALSSMRTNGVRMLLMGGQACVFYGAAEFSRDLDLLVLVDGEILGDTNLSKLQDALSELQAAPIAIPDFRAEHLLRGHAVHFRCLRPDVDQLRIDVMSNLRGVAPFEELWARRTTLEIDGQPVELLSLPDLVLAKKTQRDKDWPMIRRLVDQSFFGHAHEPTEGEIAFWLGELRTVESLMEAVQRWPEEALTAAGRPAVEAALAGDYERVDNELQAEERAERRRDREYWEPLKR